MSVSGWKDNEIFVFDINYTDNVTVMEVGQGLHSRALHKVKNEVVSWLRCQIMVLTAPVSNASLK